MSLWPDAVTVRPWTRRTYVDGLWHGVALGSIVATALLVAYMWIETRPPFVHVDCAFNGSRIAVTGITPSNARVACKARLARGSTSHLGVQ